jgi:hypothetical protein
MRLALSSAAAPGASLGELLEAAARRGLAAVELVEGHGHGIDPGLTGLRDAEDAATRAAVAGVSIAAYRLTAGFARGCGDDSQTLARLADALGARILLPLASDAGDDTDSWEEAGAAVDDLRGRGVDALPVLPAGPAALRALAGLGWTGPVAWDADPAAGELAETGQELLALKDIELELVGLRGGGPESTEQEGRGVGALMARLALSGFGGVVALSPSSERYRVIWDAWLGRRGGWGCGSKSEDRTLVTLGCGA